MVTHKQFCVQIPSLPTVYDEAVRLRGGSNNCEGRLEMYIARRRQWETACDPNFGSKEAEVVCRQLGCGTQGAARTSVQEYVKLSVHPPYSCLI